jgi:hypothetical protein
MKKQIFYAILSIILLSSIAACKKKTTSTSTTTIGSEFFVEEKGMRKIWGMESSNSGLGAFAFTHLTVSPAGKIHAVFAYTRLGVNGGLNDDWRYRKLIDINTGDTTPIAAPPALDITAYQENNGSILLIPYTQQLVYSSANQTDLIGEPSWAPILNVGPYNRKIYQNNQTLSDNAYYNVFSDSIEIYGTVKTATINIAKVFVPTERMIAGALDITEAGQTLAFSATSSNLKVYDYSSGNEIASVPASFFNASYNYKKSNNSVIMRTKRSQDNTKIIGLIYDQNYSTVSTFVYTIATKTFTIKISNATEPHDRFTNYATTSFDDDGNIFYVNQSGYNEIRKLSASGDAIYKSGFLKGNGQIFCVKNIGGKIFAAVGINGNNQYSDTRSTGKLLIAVAE